MVMSTCETCSHYTQDYSDDGYLPTGRCLFTFPPGLSFDRCVREDDTCDLFTTDDLDTEDNIG